MVGVSYFVRICPFVLLCNANGIRLALSDFLFLGPIPLTSRRPVLEFGEGLVVVPVETGLTAHFEEFNKTAIGDSLPWPI